MQVEKVGDAVCEHVLAAAQELIAGDGLGGGHFVPEGLGLRRHSAQVPAGDARARRDLAERRGAVELVDSELLVLQTPGVRVLSEWK